ncbi:rhodanese-like domain-containing protein [Thioalkalivibrio sp.]|uniref:rhodanese-like domain-containing protein n=1 Tax=Thioalkalivibrio sp. TaxID=2093813 RepID=UPI0012D51D5D|nr:rhodanese-like domain-containing protein [Thioalkalivibrio sp.]TVP78900.1 MAG: rhodanese-like domain-containing protein [Thioalkalivibrio sp.]
MKIGNWWPFGRVPEMPAEDLAAAVADGSVQVLDVRTGAEFRRSRIPGARHLPITRFSKPHLEELDLDRERPVVAICLTAHRSIPAVRKLAELGYDARQLKGGMRAWWKTGGPTESG